MNHKLTMSLDDLQTLIGYPFRHRLTLEQALTHRSYAFESGLTGFDNQRLEFLGDAVLDCVIAEALYLAFPELQEGELSRLRSRLVCEQALYVLALELGLDGHLKLGKGEAMLGGAKRSGILSDAYEALIGAIYIDGGFEASRNFILKQHAKHLAVPDGDWLALDAKTRLQEMAQAQHQSVRYEILSRTGPSHAPEFEVAVWFGDERIGCGKGGSKKEAQQAAASQGIDFILKS